MNQLELFYEVVRLEPDCFLSGTPSEPDPYEPEWERYVYPAKEVVRLAQIIPFPIREPLEDIAA